MDFNVRISPTGSLAQVRVREGNASIETGVLDQNELKQEAVSFLDALEDILLHIQDLPYNVLGKTAIELRAELKKEKDLT